MCVSTNVGRCTCIILLLAALPALTGHGPVAGDVLSVMDDSLSPRFPPAQLTNVFVAAGETARLSCNVKRLGDKSVLWVRERDLHILSFDDTIFTADSRFSVRAEGGSYLMLISKTQIKDTGRYECQVNTEPKMSLFFNLTVLDQPLPKLDIWLSAPSAQVPEGYTMTFTCEARYIWSDNQEPPPNFPLQPIILQWYNEDQPITFQTDRGGILVDTDRTTTSSISHLTIAHVTKRDEGNYTCVGGGKKVHILLEVLNSDANYDEHMEAMQRDQSHGAIDGASVVVQHLPLSILTLTITLLRTLHT